MIFWDKGAVMSVKRSKTQCKAADKLTHHGRGGGVERQTGSAGKPEGPHERRQDQIHNLAEYTPSRMLFLWQQKPSQTREFLNPLETVTRTVVVSENYLIFWVKEQKCICFNMWVLCPGTKEQHWVFFRGFQHRLSGVAGRAPEHRGGCVSDPVNDVTGCGRWNWWLTPPRPQPWWDQREGYNSFQKGGNMGLFQYFNIKVEITTIINIIVVYI